MKTLIKANVAPGTNLVFDKDTGRAVHMSDIAWMYTLESQRMPTLVVTSTCPDRECAHEWKTTSISTFVDYDDDGSRGYIGSFSSKADFCPECGSPVIDDGVVTIK